MSDDGERTVERRTTREETGERSPGDASERTVDDAAESFLDLEAQLRGTGGVPVRGRAVDVAKVDADAVPADYPVEIATAEALALTLVVDDADEREVTVYFAWRDGEADDRLDRLLTLHGIPHHRFADLHGESLLLEYRDGDYLPVVPDERVRGTARGVYGVVAGFAVNLLALGLIGLGFGGLLSSVGGLAVLLAVNLFLLPLATYVDGWYLRTQTDWGQGPAFWALLALLPGVNLLSVPLYLLTRRRATPLVD